MGIFDFFKPQNKFITISIGEFEISIQRQEFLKIIGENEQWGKNDNWDFDYAEAAFSVSRDIYNLATVDNNNNYIINCGCVDSVAELISNLDKKNKFVVYQMFYIYDELWSKECGSSKSTNAFEVEFVNCDCPVKIREFYCNGHFIQYKDEEFIKSNSEYFSTVVLEEDREIEQEIVVKKLHNHNSINHPADLFGLDKTSFQKSVNEKAEEDKLPKTYTKNYHDNGQLEEEGNYKDGEKDGMWKYYRENGELWKTGNYKTIEGVTTTNRRIYYPSGELMQEGIEINGKLEGMLKGYYKSGQLEYEKNWKHDGKGSDEPIGVWKLFNENGELSYKEDYTKKAKEAEEARVEEEPVNEKAEEQVKEIHDLVFYQIEEISDDEILSDGSFRNLRGLQIKAHTLEILEESKGLITVSKEIYGDDLVKGSKEEIIKLVLNYEIETEPFDVVYELYITGSGERDTYGSINKEQYFVNEPKFQEASGFFTDEKKAFQEFKIKFKELINLHASSEELYSEFQKFIKDYEKDENVYGPYLSIFSVVGCDLNWTNEENKDCCAYRLDLRDYSANVINQEGAVYTVESEFGESYTGTKEELIKIHNDLEFDGDGSIFYDMDISDVMYVFQGKIYAEDTEDGERLEDATTDIYCRNEYFFDNYEEAEIYFKEDLENAKSKY